MKKFLMILSLLSVPLIFQWDIYQVLKLRTFDALVAQGEPSGYFTVLNITEEDIDREGGYPLPRYRLAEIQHDLLEHGAIGVGWVIGFPHPDRLGGDEAFAYSMSFSKTVLPLFEHSNGEYPDTVGTVILGEEAGGFKASAIILRCCCQDSPSAEKTPSKPISFKSLRNRDERAKPFGLSFKA